MEEDGRGEFGDDNGNREAIQLKNENRKLLEENNFLKIKVDILLDMVSYLTPRRSVNQRSIY